MTDVQGKTVVFFPEGAFGPTNNCIGIGDVLRRAGHRVIFVIEESFAGTLEEKGFEERLMRLAPPPEVEEEPGQFWKDFIRETAPVFRKSTFDQLGEFIAPTWEALLDGARYVDERLVEIFEEVQPDAIVEDNVCAFPAIPASGRPWVRIVSCNPLELKDEELPPPFSGLPIDDRSAWSGYRDEYRRVTEEMQAGFSEFCTERGASPLPEGEMIHESPWLNLYLYPREVDYPRSRALGRTWHNLESSVRATDVEWKLPPELGDRDGALIYVSLGSLGSGDVPLMKSLVAALAETPHRYVVSKGPQHAEYELAEQHGGGGVPAAGLGPATRGPGDHPRRQQHDDRVPAFRQADGPAPDLLGPARQRPANRRDRLRSSAAHLLVRGRRSARGDRSAARRPWTRRATVAGG